MLPLGTVLERARLTPAEIAELEAKQSASRDDDCRDPSVSKEDHDAVRTVDTVHVAAASAAVWFPDLLGYRQIVLKDGVPMAYAETLQELFFHGIAKSPLGARVVAWQVRSMVPTTTRSLVRLPDRLLHIRPHRWRDHLLNAVAAEKRRCPGAPTYD